MSHQLATLLCWHSERAGIEVLDQTIKALRNRHIGIDQVVYLVQTGRERDIPDYVGNASLQIITIPLSDPTQHAVIYEQMRSLVLPKLHSLKSKLHINVSPGTPAMHSVWLVLHAGGSFPEGTRLWSSQYNHLTKRTRIDPVEFSITTYLAEIRRLIRIEPELAVYEPETHSVARHKAFENLSRYARVSGAPLLILGERGTGKTRLVETYVAILKGRKKTITVPCGGLDSTLSESLLFGHRKGAFTGAADDRPGILAEADGGILFLDEVQDLPKTVQRKLVRVFQDRKRRYRPVGSDQEESVDAELVCASNLPLDKLREHLDDDLFDRLSHLTITIPPLRECREDIREDWNRVWRELRQHMDFPVEAPWSREVDQAIQANTLPGNLRDLQRLAFLFMAWWHPTDPNTGIRSALSEWQRLTSMNVPDNEGFGQGSRTERIRWFRARLAQWAKKKNGTWAAAAKALKCDEKTLRKDSELQDDGNISPKDC